MGRLRVPPEGGGGGSFDQRQRGVERRRRKKQLTRDTKRANNSFARKSRHMHAHVHTQPKRKTPLPPLRHHDHHDHRHHHHHHRADNREYTTEKRAPHTQGAHAHGRVNIFVPHGNMVYVNTQTCVHISRGRARREEGGSMTRWHARASARMPGHGDALGGRNKKGRRETLKMCVRV